MTEDKRTFAEIESRFPDRLRAARELRKLSQGDLASRTGLQPSAVSHFETGRRSPWLENLKRLADALHVTTDFLLGRSDDPQVAGTVANQMFRDADKRTFAEIARASADAAGRTTHELFDHIENVVGCAAELEGEREKLGALLRRCIPWVEGAAEGYDAGLDSQKGALALLPDIRKALGEE